MADPADNPSPVEMQIAGGVATITLNAPATRNALSAAMRAGLTVALTTAGADPQVRVIVLTHRGPVFCSGMDLREESAGPGGQGVRELPAILRLIMRNAKPVIAAVKGPARAGGVGLMAAADIVVAAPTATFGFSEVRLGLIPAVITVPVLHRVSPVAARELFLTGVVIDAPRAEQIGLVNVVAPDVDAAVVEYRTSLLQGGPTALTGTKALLTAGLDDSAERYAELLTISAAQFASAEGREGAAAFAQKRPAAWLAATGADAGNRG